MSSAWNWDLITFGQQLLAYQNFWQVFFILTHSHTKELFHKLKDYGFYKKSLSLKKIKVI